MRDEHASMSVLYPDDVPKGQATPPQSYLAERAAAERRLTGNVKPTAPQPEPDLASSWYPEDQPNAGNGEAAAPDADLEEILYKNDDAAEFEAAKVESFFTTHALAALQDGDEERAGELQAASQAFVADAQKHGAAAEDVEAALAIVNEAASDRLPSEVQEQRRREVMQSLIDEWGGETFKADITKARRFIQDLDKLMPGTIASLERTGAGNRPELIKLAVKEAKRRGY